MGCSSARTARRTSYRRWSGLLGCKKKERKSAASMRHAPIVGYLFRSDWPKRYLIRWPSINANRSQVQKTRTKVAKTGNQNRPVPRAVSQMNSSQTVSRRNNPPHFQVVYRRFCEKNRYQDAKTVGRRAAAEIGVECP